MNSPTKHDGQPDACCPREGSLDTPDTETQDLPTGWLAAINTGPSKRLVSFGLDWDDDGPGKNKRENPKKMVEKIYPDTSVETPIILPKTVVTTGTTVPKVATPKIGIEKGRPRDYHTQTKVSIEESLDQKENFLMIHEEIAVLQEI